MRKTLGVLGLVGGVMGIWLARDELLRWGVQSVLSYSVGAPVQVARVKALAWQGGLQWRLEVEEVRLSSTLPADTFPTAKLEEVKLVGEGRRLKEVSLRGGWVALIRLGKGLKNFRYFPRRGRPSPQRFTVKAEGVRFSLLNGPADLALSLRVDSLEGKLDIDSVAFRLEALRARLFAQEVCWRQVRSPLPAPLELRAQGCLYKPTQDWEGLTLLIQAPEEWVRFSGCVESWTYLWGSFAGQVKISRFPRLSAELAGWGLQAVQVVGWAGGKAYGACLGGSWERGPYRVCMTGEGSALRRLYGRVGWEGLGWAGFDGGLEEMAVWGGLHGGGLVAGAKGRISLRRRLGQLKVHTAWGDTIWVEGSLDTLSGRWRLGGQRLQGTWTKRQGLVLLADTLSLAELLQAWTPYRRLLRPGSKEAVPVELRARAFRWDTLAVGENLAVRWRPGSSLEAQARVRLPFWPETLAARAWQEPPSGRWALSLQGSTGYLYAEGEGDTAQVSATGWWYIYPWQVVGTVRLSERALRLRRGWVGGPSTEMEVNGILSPAGANAEVEATLPIAEALVFFPLEGVQVSGGRLNLRFCAQGAWDTLLRWDNPLEGTATLEGVQAYFPRLRLPLSDFRLKVAFSPEETRLLQLSGRVGAARVQAQGQVRGTLSYLYTDWYRLQGRLQVEAESVRLADFWRRAEGDTIRRQVRLPTQMDLAVEARLRSVEVYGLPFEVVTARARLTQGLLEIDTLGLMYGLGHLAGWGVLDIADSTCYTFSGRAKAERIDLASVLRRFELDTIPTFQRLGLKGFFSGSLQASLRFSPSVNWKENSIFYAQGQVSQGQFYTPRWLRWLRPYYLAAYRDSMDFWAEVPSFQITDGFLKLEEGLLLTRAGALRLMGYHYLPQDRFLYQIRGARLYRRLQRHAELPRLAYYMADRLDQSLFLVYVEKLGPRVRVRYPVRYLLRRLIVPSLAEPVPSASAYRSGFFRNR
ncbi:MAG: hypothetical protein KatS3mg026_0962 [Bacteroidia bacterium]|nr:MAG: hypothetical protein KatS3mg026_0962 [Bacteroidia bacterium]